MFRAACVFAATTVLCHSAFAGDPCEQYKKNQSQYNTCVNQVRQQQAARAQAQARAQQEAFARQQQAAQAQQRTQQEAFVRQQQQAAQIRAQQGVQQRAQAEAALPAQQQLQQQRAQQEALARQQQQAVQARAQQEAQQRQQQAVAAQQAQNAKAVLTQPPTASRTAGMTPITLGNGQRVFVNSQGTFFDANGNPISNRSVATATKGTSPVTAAPTPVVVPNTVRAAGSANADTHGAQSLSPNPPVQVRDVAPSPSPSTASVGSIGSRVQSGGSAASDANKQTVQTRSTQASLSNSIAATPSPAPGPSGAVGRPDAARLNNPVGQALQSNLASTLSPLSNGASVPANTGQALSPQDLARMGALPKEQQDVLRKLSPEQVAKNKASGEWERTLKAFENANVSVTSRVLQELPRQAVNVTAGAAVGIGQVGVETGKAAFELGQRVGTPIGKAIGTVAGDVLYDRKSLAGDVQRGTAKVIGEIRDDGAKAAQIGAAIARDPAKAAKDATAVAGRVATNAGQAVSTGAANYAGAIERGDGYEVGRALGRTTAAAALMLEGAPAGKSTTRVANVLKVGSEDAVKTSAEKATEADLTTSTVRSDVGVVGRLDPTDPRSTSAPRNGSRLVLNQGLFPTCGPNSCAMLLDTMGKPVDITKLVVDSKSTGRGATMANLASALKENGLPNTVVRSGMSVEALAEATAHGVPAIVRMTLDRGSHAVVVDGITVRNGIAVVAIRDPALGRQYFTPIQEFTKKFSGEAILTK